ncbi:MAG: phosphatase PAP2 family protein [Candidatus Izimaplasma sp.]|nr:phosphatase PAP2 family protein [Candidatus Izimaplasma bacterium]
MTIDVILFIQRLRTPFLDVFFNVISFLGEETIYMLLLSIVYFGIDKKKGEFLAFILFFTGLLNTFLKGLISAQRPFEKYPNQVDNLRPQTTGGSSFPSGHTQNFTAFLVSGALLLKQKKYLVITFILAVLMGLSRMYLGVHFLEDVLTSIVLGTITAYIGYFFFFNYYHKMTYVYLVVAFIALLLIIVVPTSSFLDAFSLMAGFSLAMLFEKTVVKVVFSPKLYKRIIRVVTGITLMILVKWSFSFVVDPEKYVEVLMNMSLVFIGFGVYPYIIKIYNRLILNQ